MTTGSFLERDFKNRIAKLELIFSDDFMTQFTNIIKKEIAIGNNPDDVKKVDREKYYNCLGQLYDIIMEHCETNHIEEVNYIYRGKQILNGFVFFYKQPSTGEVEFYFISFIAGQGVEHFCFQIFDECYQSNAIDIEKILKSQAYQLTELKESLSKLEKNIRYSELLKQCSEAHDFIQSKQKEMFERLFSGVAYDVTIRRKIQYEQINDINIEEEAIKWIERIILPALKEESMKALFYNDGKVTIYVELRLDTYELNVCDKERHYMKNFGKARIIQERVYYGKFANAILDKAVELLTKMKNEGSLITGKKSDFPYLWVYECLVEYEKQ